jgi:H/ACA ribonucleoprotein complex subunit 2
MAAEKPDKKEKKDKKRSDEAGVSKPKKDKKDKKDKKEKLAAAAEEQLQKDVAKQEKGAVKKVAAADNDDDSDVEAEVAEVPLVRTVVPFAIPLADEKGTKKVYKTIRKGKASPTLALAILLRPREG